MSLHRTSQAADVMRWRPFLRYLPFALLIDGVVFYAGWLIWKVAAH
jgi:hypothetical protein